MALRFLRWRLCAARCATRGPSGHCIIHWSLPKCRWVPLVSVLAFLFECKGGADPAVVYVRHGREHQGTVWDVSHGDIGDIKYSAYLTTQHYSTLAPKKRKLGLAANKINTKSDSKLPGCPTSRHGDEVACGCIKRRKRRTWTWNRFRLTLREPSPCHAWHILAQPRSKASSSSLQRQRPGSIETLFCPSSKWLRGDVKIQDPRNNRVCMFLLIFRTTFHPIPPIFGGLKNFDPSHAIPRWKRLWSPAEAAAQPIWERLLTNLLHLWKLAKSAGRQISSLGSLGSSGGFYHRFGMIWHTFCRSWIPVLGIYMKSNITDGW